MLSKVILHLCADLGSDSYPYQLDPDYEVIKIGEDIGVEGYVPDKEITGIIANPPCTEFSTARSCGKARNGIGGFKLLSECLRIIHNTKPKWWVLENPATGSMKRIMGNPVYTYQPWEYGSPWTKKTSLWGQFNIPEKIYNKWEDVTKIDGLYTRPGRPKPSLAFMHKSHIKFIPEFAPFVDYVKNDADFRSLCSQGFAKAFKEANDG